MKVDTPDESFQPMILTLETREEVVIMWYLLHLPDVLNIDTLYAKNKEVYWKRTPRSYADAVDSERKKSMSEAFDKYLTIPIDQKTGLPYNTEL